MADEVVFGFDRPTGEALIKLVRKPLNGYAVESEEPPSRNVHAHVAYLAAGDTITARSGVTPGTGEVTLYWRNPLSGDLEDLGFDPVTVYNCTLQTPSSDDIYIQIKRDPFGDWWWDVDDCTA